MNAEQFRQRAELNQTLADYLDEVAQEADPDQAHRAGGLALLFGVAVYALYRVAKNHFDHQRGLDEAELRQLMLDQVDALVQKGWDRDKALDAVLKVSKDVASLRPDSPAFKAAIALLQAGNTATDG
jgi:hypothetical protein